MNKFYAFVVLFCFPCLSYAVQIQQLTDSVWIAVQPEEEQFNDSNTLIMRGKSGVLVVDSQQSADDVTTIINFINQETALPVTVLVNTHWHSDHTQGNALYKKAYGDKLTIIGHPNYLEDIPQRAGKALKERIAYLETQLPLAIDGLKKGTKRDGTPMSEAEMDAQTKAVERASQWLRANKNAHFVVPDRVIREPLELSEYGFSARVIPMSGHTRADLVVYLPQQKILACGDLLDAVPYLGHGNTRQWLETLGIMQDLSPQLWLPGHGKPLRDDSLLTAMQFYLDQLLTQVNLHKKADLETLKQRMDLSASRARLAGDDARKQRFFDQSIDEAITQTYQSERQHTTQ